MKLTDYIIHRFEEKYKEGNTPWARGIVDASVKRLVHLAQKHNNHPRVLDIGCGDGWLSFFLADHGCIVEGIDSSPTAILKAKKYAKKAHAKNVHFRVGDGLTFPYIDHQFDVVFDSGFLHHLPENTWSTYKRGVDRVLAYGGLLYLGVFSDDSVKKGFDPKKAKRMWHKVKDVSGFWTYDHFFTRKMLEKFFGGKYALLFIEKEKKPSDNGSVLWHCIFQKK